MLEEQTGKRRANKKFAVGTAAGVVAGGLVIVAGLSLVQPRAALTATPGTASPSVSSPAAAPSVAPPVVTPPVVTPSLTPTPTLTPTVVPTTAQPTTCLLYTSPSPRDRTRSRMPSSA